MEISNSVPKITAAGFFDVDLQLIPTVMSRNKLSASTAPLMTQAFQITDFIFAACRHNVNVSYYSFPISNIREKLMLHPLMERVLQFQFYLSV